MSTSLKKLKKQRGQTKTLHDVGETIQRITALHRQKIETQTEGVKTFRDSLLQFAGAGLPLEVVYPEIPKAQEKPLLVAVGPERGLVGDLHREIARSVTRQLEWHSYARILVAGGRLCGFLKSTSDIVFSPYPALSDRPTRDELTEHVRTILDGRRKGEWNVVELLYPQYDSITSYHVEEKKVLPLEVRLRKGALSVIPAKAGIQDSGSRVKPGMTNGGTLFFIEPNIETIMRQLEEMLFAAELYEVFLEARYVELSQRLLASTRAAENAKHILKELQRQYLHEVRARTTKTINEIFTGRKAYEMKNAASNVALEWVV